MTFPASGGLSRCLSQALKEFEQFKDKIPHHDVIGVVDYGAPSAVRRFGIYSLENEDWLCIHHVAHGSGSSDPSDPAYAVKFSNTINSHCSSLGAVKTGGVYYGRYGRSLRLRGLEKGINDNIFIRTIVLHGSKYVSDRHAAVYGRMGQSWGCLAMDFAVKDKVIDLLRDGRFIWLSR